MTSKAGALKNVASSRTGNTGSWNNILIWGPSGHPAISWEEMSLLANCSSPGAKHWCKEQSDDFICIMEDILRQRRVISISLNSWLTKSVTTKIMSSYQISVVVVYYKEICTKEHVTTVYTQWHDSFYNYLSTFEAEPYNVLQPGLELSYVGQTGFDLMTTLLP